MFFLLDTVKTYAVILLDNMKRYEPTTCAAAKTRRVYSELPINCKSLENGSMWHQSNSLVVFRAILEFNISTRFFIFKKYEPIIRRLDNTPGWIPGNFFHSSNSNHVCLYARWSENKPHSETRYIGKRSIGLNFEALILAPFGSFRGAALNRCANYDVIMIYAYL